MASSAAGPERDWIASSAARWYSASSPVRRAASSISETALWASPRWKDISLSSSSYISRAVMADCAGGLDEEEAASVGADAGACGGAGGVCERAAPPTLAKAHTARTRVKCIINS